MTLLVRVLRRVLAGVLAIVMWLPAAARVMPGGRRVAQAAQVQVPVRARQCQPEHDDDHQHVRG